MRMFVATLVERRESTTPAVHFPKREIPRRPVRSFLKVALPERIGCIISTLKGGRHVRIELRKLPDAQEG